ncbi:MAG: F0F1 ATP synthase subunit A [Pirellulaceae bacterium]|nr:F0F1 ATP synthase subunit A [Pirellulaceae bacterium]
MSAEHEVDNFHHVRDATGFDFPRGMADAHGHGTLDFQLPEIFGWQLTKFMVLQVVAAVVVFFIFRGLARRIQNGEPARGRFWNFWEAIALYLRDEVVRPTIGDHGHDHGDEYDFHGAGSHGHGVPAPNSHPADQYLPFIWSCFFYILFCNLLGAVPWMGSATGNINVTGVLAFCAFVATVMYGFKAMGPVGFLNNMKPDTGISGPVGMFLSYFIFLIEVFGFFVKHAVLAVRLFANIMGGHTVVAVILGFIAAVATSNSFLWGAVTLGSVFGQVLIGLLELFVAFLQAYVFVFLATIFLAGAVHEH